MPDEKQYEAMTTELNGRGMHCVYFGMVFEPNAWVAITPQQRERLQYVPTLTIREKGVADG